jgi:alanine-glyoxylate transaminase/serine-glyoxylate transaminase/serine-pyruvate transaminase
VQAHLIEERLRADKEHSIKAVCVVHNETSTGATSNILAVRRAIDAARHPACCWSTASRPGLGRIQA